MVIELFSSAPVVIFFSFRLKNEKNRGHQHTHRTKHLHSRTTVASATTSMKRAVALSVRNGIRPTLYMGMRKVCPACNQKQRLYRCSFVYGTLSVTKCSEFFCGLICTIIDFFLYVNASLPCHCQLRGKRTVYCTQAASKK